jgi:hypothetical protein
MLLTRQGLAALQAAATVFSANSFPRGRLRGVVQALYALDEAKVEAKPYWQQPKSPYAKQDEAARGMFPAIIGCIDALAATVVQAAEVPAPDEVVKRAVAWLLLEEYWDYLLPAPAKGGAHA